MERVSLETTYDKYLAYLESQKWAELRNKALKRDEYHCSICGCPEALEVHHLKYPDILGTEPLSDLMTLCHDCHVKLETYKKGHTKSMRMYEWRPPKEFEWQYWLKFESLEEYDKTYDELILYKDNKLRRMDKGNSRIIIYLQKENEVCTFAKDLTHSQIQKFDAFVHEKYSFCEPKLIKTEET